MKCPHCGHIESKVVETRAAEDGSFIRRRRMCEKCETRFTTYEKVELRPLIIIKKDNNREPFQRSKVEDGILRACYKRPVSAEDITNVIDEIERDLYKGESQEIKSNEVGALVMEKLKDLDPVAYVRFASVYREFKDVETFADEIKKFLKKEDQ